MEKNAPGPNATFNWTLPVDSWSEEQLEAWARDNITKDTPLHPGWQQNQVSIWARKALNFSEKSAKILIEQEIDGKTLLDPPVQTLADLIALLPGIPTGQVKRVWEKLKQSLANVPFEEKFTGLVIVHSTTMWSQLLDKQSVRVSPIPTEDHQKRVSSLWQGLAKELAPINAEDKHKGLMTKVRSLMAKLASQYSDIRYWVDDSGHRAGELYPDLMLYRTPTKESSSTTETREFSSDQKPPHDTLEWNRQLFIIEVANITEFMALDGGNVTLEQLDSCSIRKKIAQIAGYLLKNLAITGTEECYGAITCYSHWLFVKAELINGNVSLVVHNQVLHLSPHEIEMEQQTALSFLLSLLVFMKVNAHPIIHSNKLHDTSLALLCTLDDCEICLNTEIISITTHSFVMKALWPDTHQLVCIKCDRSARGLLANEIDVIKRLSAANVPNVAHLTACGTLHRAGEQYSCLVTNMYGECIDTLLPLPLVEAQRMASNVLGALQGMHELGLIHSDVKPGNIVRHWNTSLGRYCYTLIDFGFSFQDGCVAKDEWGCSIEYASIEMLDGSIPTAKDDLKALWYTVVHVMQGSLPWQHFSPKLTKWAKEAFKDELAAQNNELYVQLANVYETIDASPVPYQAWQQWLAA